MIFDMIFLCASVLIFLGALIWIDIDLRREEKTYKEELAKLMTNADRIRSMTNEELSDFLTKIRHPDCVEEDGGFVIEDRWGKTMIAKGAWLDWLKEEVENE